MKALPLLLAAALLAPQEPAPSQQPDASDLMNTLLSSFPGFAEVTGEELEREVAEIGGIPFRTSVPLDYMTRDHLSRYVSDLFDEEYSETRAAADARTLVAFDLLAPGTNLRELRKRLLLENVAGFYDERPGHRRLYAVSSDRRLTPANQLILSHELRHALQDQYARIHELLPDSVGDFDDRRLALLSLLEGDATFVMEKFLVHRMGVDSSALEGLSLPALPPTGAPPVLADEMVLPYVKGLDFVRALYTKGGWSAVQRAWSRPPESTDEILHPERYPHHPQTVEVAISPPSGRAVNEGVLGEILISTLLGPSAPAVDGWAGDHFRTFDLGGRTLLAWKSVWQGPSARAAFRDALEARFRASHGEPRVIGSFHVFTKGSWSVGIGGRDEVFFISSDDANALEGVLRGLS